MRKGHRGKKYPDRPVSPGYVRKDEEFYEDCQADSPEEMLRRTFELLLPKILLEMREQRDGAFTRPFNAWAELRINPGFKLTFSIHGEPPSLMELLGGGKG